MSKKKLVASDLNVDLWAILETQSETFHTEDMQAEVKRQLDMIDGVTYETDDYGNIYATKGKSETYPVYVCHIDTVHPIKEGYQVFRDAHGMYFAMSWTPKDGLQQAGIGGDDKCGIIACLELLHRLKKVKCAFFLDEEKGCKGSENGKLEFFEDGRFAIQIDRKHGSDIIVEGNGTELCSGEFKGVMEELGKVYGYAPTTGMNTDVVKLKTRGLGISAVNISAGYWNPHGKNEFIAEYNLMNAISFCLAIASDKKVYEHRYVPKATPQTTTTRSSTSGWGSGTTDRTYNGNGAAGRNWESYANNKRPTCLQCDATLRYTEEDARVCDSCWKAYFTADEPKLFVTVDERGDQYLVDESLIEPEGYDDEAAKGRIGKTLLPEYMLAMLPTTICLMCSVPLHFSHEKDQGYCDRCGECGADGCRDRLKTSDELLLQRCGAHLEVGKADGWCETEGCETELVTADEKKTKLCQECVKMYVDL